MVIIITFGGLIAIGSLLDYVLGGAIAPREVERYPALAGLGVLAVFFLLMLLKPASKRLKVVRIG